MIEEILPEVMCAVEARCDRADLSLPPEEEAALGRAVEQRRREFASARACARDALVGLGLPPVPIPIGARGEPRWPVGVVGSITHCNGYRACAVGRASEILTVGIDAEPNGPLPDGVLAAIARAEELSRLRELRSAAPEVHWDRLLFSAKESVYKAWFPVTRRRLGFEDATLTFDLRRHTFAALLLVPASPLDGESPTELRGRWLVRDGLVVTAIALRRFFGGCSGGDGARPGYALSEA
jgi:4'-phosphopantetheinyl transferase EntD